MSTLHKMEWMTMKHGRVILSSVGCVAWSVAYAPVMVFAVMFWQPRHYSLQAIERTKQGNHRHNAATARFVDIPFQSLCPVVMIMFSTSQREHIHASNLFVATICGYH